MVLLECWWQIMIERCCVTCWCKSSVVGANHIEDISNTRIKTWGMRTTSLYFYNHELFLLLRFFLDWQENPCILLSSLLTSVPLPLCSVHIRTSKSKQQSCAPVLLAPITHSNPILHDFLRSIIMRCHFTMWHLYMALSHNPVLSIF